MTAVFISHSAEDAPVARLSVDLLTQGVGLSHDDVFCTSVPSQIPLGTDFKAQIKVGLMTSSLLLPVMTEAFTASRFCMFELGASWAESKLIIPILVPPVTYSDMAPLLQDTQAIVINSEPDLCLLRDAVAQQVGIGPRRKSVWTKHVRRFISELRLLLPRREAWLYALRNTWPDGLHEVVGCFQMHRIPNRPNVVWASGRVYWARPSLSFRGEWVTEEAVARADRLLFHYTFNAPPDGEMRQLKMPTSHEGVINLTRRADFSPIRGDLCFSGYVHDLFEWRENTSTMYAERVREPWETLISELEARGSQLYDQLSTRFGLKYRSGGRPTRAFGREHG